MAKDMKIKFDKYWENYSLVLSFEVILNPRYKIKLVEFYFQNSTSHANEEREAKLKSIFDEMHKLYGEYEIFSKTTHNSSTVGSSNVGVDVVDKLDGFESFQSQFISVERDKSQLTMYLDEPERPRSQELDVLQFWKDNQGRYPQLALMARDILSIPITNIASESSFSIEGQVLSKYRTSLISSNVEALLCTRDWLFSFKDDESDKEMEERLVEDIEALIPTNSNF